MSVDIDTGQGECPKCGRIARYTLQYLGQFPNNPMGKPRYRTTWHCKHGQDHDQIPLKLWFRCYHPGEMLEFSLDELELAKEVLADGSEVFHLHCPDCNKKFMRIYGVKE